MALKLGFCRVPWSDSQPSESCCVLPEYGGPPVKSRGVRYSSSTVLTVMRREKSEAAIMVLETNVVGNRGRGRSKNRWLDAVKSDTRIVGVSVNDVRDPAK